MTQLAKVEQEAKLCMAMRHGATRPGSCGSFRCALMGIASSSCTLPSSRLRLPKAQPERCHDYNAWTTMGVGVTVRRSFRKLQDCGLIERIGSRKAGYWRIVG